MTATTYIGYRLLPAALGILDPDRDHRVANAVELFVDDRAGIGYGATIDWDALDALPSTSSEQLRVDIARSLLDGTPVALAGIASLGAATYGLLMPSLARSWPATLADIEERMRAKAVREIDPDERRQCGDQQTPEPDPARGAKDGQRNRPADHTLCVARLDDTLERALGAVLDLQEALCQGTDANTAARWPGDPDSLLWACECTALIAEETSSVFEILSEAATEWADTRPEWLDLAELERTRRGTTYLQRVGEAPAKLAAAAAACRQTSRRGDLVELRSFHDLQVQVCVGERVWVHVKSAEPLAGPESTSRWAVRDARPDGSPLENRPWVTCRDTDLPTTIARVLDGDLADIGQRPRLRAAADEARRQLMAIMAYRNQRKPGDPQRVRVGGGSPEGPQLTYSDSSQDLVHVLVDLYDEGWPVAEVIRDGLAAACRVLASRESLEHNASRIDGSTEARGLEYLVGHRGERGPAAALVRQLVLGWAEDAARG